MMKTCILTKALHAHAAHTKLPLYGNFGILFLDRNNMSPRLIYQKCCCIHYTQLDDGTNTYIFLLISFLKIDTWIALRNLAML